MSADPKDKDRITCHILDTTTGQPARGVRVKLELLPTPSQPNNASSSSSASPTGGATTGAATTILGDAGAKVFESQTDDDGRIKSWLPYSSATSSGEVPVYTLEDVFGSLADVPSDSRWRLRFDTAGYFGGADKTFYPEVDVTFTVRRGERYHVPLLLAPYGYSTYRGS
ncbi:putative 5-hydroxyisourate hydrolase [Madurella mycetomatis]|uniref:hydroxyisourate hydrolase n=1 Tax=Madurella mycetomatis TaxID=100816 RepID=A0A175W1U3_9PEZI|nr:putative 5-hydroxyisourate hydrolase [Madurella mycetomatis]